VQRRRPAVHLKIIGVGHIGFKCADADIALERAGSSKITGRYRPGFQLCIQSR